MKKFVFTIFCSLVFATGVYANTIVTSPIDSRPISYDYLNNLSNIAGDNVVSVDKKNLDFFSTYEPDNRLGNSEKVREEMYELVEKNNNENSTVIINTSSYITNGLVGSRCGVNYTSYYKALRDLKDLATNFDKPYYYVNLSVPRALPETRFNEIWPNDNKLKGIAHYYLKYNKESENYDYIDLNYSNVTPIQYIMEFSYVANKANELGENKLTEWERDFYNYFNKNIKNTAPYKQYVDYYIKPYEASYNILNTLIEYQKDGIIDEIVISTDDLQIPNSISYFNSIGEKWIPCENKSPIKFSYARTFTESGPRSIKKSIKEAYSDIEYGKANVGSGKVLNIIYGTDEVPQLIYARDLTRRQNLTPRVQFVYNDVKQNVATFDVKQPGNIARAAYNFVRHNVGNYTKKDSEIYIYDYNVKTESVVSTINKMRRAYQNNKDIALIELFDLFMPNDVFENIKNSRVEIGFDKLNAYSAWNTNANAIGLGVAHNQVYSIAKETTKRPKETLKAQLNMLAQHLIEDGIYTKSGKLALSNRGYRPNVEDRIDSKTLYNLVDTKAVTSILNNRKYEILDKVYEVRKFEVSKFCFPWGRPFDVYLEFDTDLKIVK